MGKHKLLILFFSSLFCLAGKAQNNQPKIGTLKINEIYLYKEATNKIKYKESEKIREWIEIYNGSVQNVRTRNLYFTDNLADPSKYPIRIRRRRHNKIKKDGFLAVYLARSGKSRAAKTDFMPDTGYIFLIKYSGDNWSVEDSVKLQANNKYPYSRYPDGQKFRVTDALSPGLPNTFFNESESWRKMGVTVQWGKSNTKSPELENSSKAMGAWSIGVYRTQAHKFFTTEKGIKVGSRGYKISYQATAPTTKGIREINTKGKQRMEYLDFYYNYNFKISQKFGLYAGGVYSIRLNSYIKFDQNINFTYNSTGEKVTLPTSTFSSHDYNSSIDFFDLSLVLGFRYYFMEKINFSVYYIRDFAGVNSNAGTSYKNQKTSGIYFVTEIPFWSSRARQKSKMLIH